MFNPAIRAHSYNGNVKTSVTMEIEIPVKIGEKRLVWSPLDQKWVEITVSTISVAITKTKRYIFIYDERISEGFSYDKSRKLD